MLNIKESKSFLHRFQDSVLVLFVDTGVLRNTGAKGDWDFLHSSDAMESNPKKIPPFLVGQDN